MVHPFSQFDITHQQQCNRAKKYKNVVPLCSLLKPRIMKIFILFSSVGVLAFFVGFSCASESNEANVLKWNDYKIKFGKQYKTKEIEQQKMNAFMANEKRVAENNEKYKNGDVKFKMELNHFSDMSAEEFMEAHTSQNLLTSNNLQLTQTSEHFTSLDNPYCVKLIPNYESHLIKTLPAELGKAPEEKNWVTKGAVTSVKFQDQDHQCGACWDFAAVGAIESHSFLYGAGKKLVSLSAQQILDCIGDTKYGVNDCIKGGCVTSALQYVIDNGGIEADESYPYKSEKETCKYKPDKRVATVKGFKTPVALDEELLKQIVGLIGPCACSWEIVDDFQLYSSGIYSSRVCKKTANSMNHNMLIVGYGSEGGTDYWLVKNQWDTNWGEEGYARIRRNTNECGIALANYYPII